MDRAIKTGHFSIFVLLNEDFWIELLPTRLQHIVLEIQCRFLALSSRDAQSHQSSIKGGCFIAFRLRDLAVLFFGNLQ